MGNPGKPSQFRFGFSSLLTLGCLLLGQSALPALGANQAEEDEKNAAASTDDLVLEQLRELRLELSALRNEVGQLKQSVNEIHKAAVRANAPAAPAKVSLDDDPVMGNPDAKVAIVEFSDYQCPYCERFHSQTFPELKTTYIDTGKVQFVFRDFPLMQIHPHARNAAVAANCAGQQEKYWDMHHALFSNVKRLGPGLYPELAEAVGIALGPFQSCLEDPEQGREVDQDLAYGQTIGIRGTPHYFVGRVEGKELVEAQRVSGAKPFQAFQQIIEELLK